MRLINIIKYCFRLCLAAIVIGSLLLFFAWLTKPGITEMPIKYSPSQIEQVVNSRKTEIDTAEPLRIYQLVDYNKGPEADWYPKSESPIFAELVKKGKLPPVEQRCGPEPVVVEGVDGIGKYGGTWYRLTNQTSIPDSIVSRLSYVTLVRWSPWGYPIVPHVAKAYEVSEDNREFTFHLRKGMRWSDGHPFTADDIMFWWEHIANEKALMSDVPGIMKVRGRKGNISKVNDYEIKITFPFPNGVFLSKLASDGMSGKGISFANMLSYPEHYLRQYHPVVGNDQVIDEMMRAGKFQSRSSFFKNIIYHTQHYPDYPRLWPWVYRKYKSGSPFSFVRNPYYWMVDTQGNQLPYIDRVVFSQKNEKMLPIAAAGGEVSMQNRFIPFEEYTYLMSEKERGDYDLYHWYNGDRGTFVIACNINYKINSQDTQSRYKQSLLNDRRFRQALSLAINREAIIDAEYCRLTVPAQCAPGPKSYFYEPGLYLSYTEYDPDRANQLLDEIDIIGRDYEGFRTFPDGSRMTFYLNIAQGYSNPGIMQLVVDDWAQIGLRVIPRIRNRSLFYTEKMGLQHELNVWVGNSEFLPIVSPRYFVPRTSACNFAIGYARWYQKGGLFGSLDAVSPGCIEPPVESDCRKVMELYEELCAYANPAQQKNLFTEILKINGENLWTINISTPPPALVIVKNGMKNVPRSAVSCWEFKTPGNTGIETYYFDEPGQSEIVDAEIADSIVNVIKPPQYADVHAGISDSEKTGDYFPAEKIFQYLFLLIVLIFFVLIVLRHPYVARRLLIMIPTLLIVSVLVFIIIQAPPGDYLSSSIMMLEQEGGRADVQMITDLRKMFWLDDPLYKRYARWMGLYWFASFDSGDTGLLQGNLGRSMDDTMPVNDKVGDRIILTILISLGSILFTWAVAIPTGIYSAVKQYSLGDYFFTFLGFIGMSIPSFLLALMLMYFAKVVFGISISGLFSSQFGAHPQWSWAKAVDLLKHIWLPVVVLGVGGTAGMIRIMRGNLLDELKKPYVVAAKAKGLRPIKLLFKYPVRIALNPFISGIGALFPQLVSGGAIIAVVLSLPTVGPLMLEALMIEDMYLAGSLLMVLSLLGVLGTLVSDLLLLWLDPRIRFTSGTR